MPDNDSNTSVWEKFRENMPVTQSWAYFDHAAVAPLPRPAAKALIDWTTSCQNDGLVDWVNWRKRLNETRDEAATLLGAAADELSLVHSTTEGITIVAESYPWRAGDNVVTFAGEFPSNSLPWQALAARGVEIREVPTHREQWQPDDLKAAIDDRTRIVATSWVGFGTGWRNDLNELADRVHRRGAELFVDAIQGAGVLPLKVADVPIDYLAADGHKWMLGPEGAGLLFIRRAHLGKLRPMGAGWNSVPETGEFTPASIDALKPAAARYEGGTFPQGLFAAFGESLKLLNAIGAEAISERLFALGEQVRQIVQARGGRVISDRSPQRFSGILSCEFPGVDPQPVRKHLLDRQIVCSVRQGRLRLSPHVYCGRDDLERLAEGLRTAGL